MKPGVTVEQARQDIDAVAAAISREFPNTGPAGPRLHDCGAAGRRRAGRSGRRCSRCLLVWRSSCHRLRQRRQPAGRARRGPLPRHGGAHGAWRRPVGALRGSALWKGWCLLSLGAMAAAGLRLLEPARALLRSRRTALAGSALVHVDTTVLAFTLATTAVWGLLFSLAPVAESGAHRPDGRAAAGRVAAPAGGIHQRLRSGLVILQIALSVVLVVGASLLVRTFLACARVDPGFRSDHVLSFKISLPGLAATATQAAIQRLRPPAAGGAGGIARGHRRGQREPHALRQRAELGRPVHHRGERGDESTAPFADNRAVTPRYFETVGATLVDGRFFTESDDEHAPPVVIVDDQLARRSWPGQSAIGQQDRGGSVRRPDIRVFGRQWWVLSSMCGIAACVENLGDQVFFAERQVQRNPMAYVVRTSGRSVGARPAVRRAVGGHRSAPSGLRRPPAGGVRRRARARRSASRRLLAAASPRSRCCWRRWACTAWSRMPRRGAATSSACVRHWARGRVRWHRWCCARARHWPASALTIGVGRRGARRARIRGPVVRCRPRRSRELRGGGRW